MKIRQLPKTLRGALCATGLALLLVGCQPSKQHNQLMVGKVDTAILLHDDPDYQSLSIEYLKENTDLRGKFVEKMKNAGEASSARDKVQAEYGAEQKKLDAKWMSKTQEFLESRHTHIRDAAQKIAEQKGIDMVIIDSQAYPTTEWGGVDITKDLSLSMSQEDPDAAASSATPEKKEG